MTFVEITNIKNEYKQVATRITLLSLTVNVLPDKLIRRSNAGTIDICGEGKRDNSTLVDCNIQINNRLIFFRITEKKEIKE